MNHRSVRILTALAGAVLWLSSLVQAQIAPHSLKVSVPFEFSVNDKVFPAGEYVVVSTPTQVELRDARAHVLASMLPHSVQSLGDPVAPKLVFTTEGRGHALRQLWLDDPHHGYELAPSKTAAALAQQRSNTAAQVRTGGNKP